MKTVIIEVRGGVVQDVYGDEDLRVVLIDWDERIDDAEANCVGELTPLPLSVAPTIAEMLIASST